VIGYRILGKSRSRTALLVHGLFSSAGFWLPYLGAFKDFRLIILDIDYGRIELLDQYIDGLRSVIDIEASGCADVIVAHSLGTLLANGLTPSYRKASFEICPVYCAKRNNTENFVEEIEGRLSNSVTKTQIVKILKHVDSTVRTYVSQRARTSERAVYIPDSDLYFAYEPKSKYVRFQGDHFDIAMAVKDIEVAVSRF